MRANSNQTLMKSKLKITLLFCFMLAAPVTAQITIDGEIVHVETDAYTVQQKWEQFTLDLSPYRGKIVKLRFTTTPGPNGNASWDWAVWGEPKIISKPDNSLTKVGFFSPVEPTAVLPGALRPCCFA